ncbi:MAG: flavodoxin [bacterium]|nr:flavodoxin [bacterium]
MKKILTQVVLLLLLAGTMVYAPQLLNGAVKKEINKMKTLVVYYSYTGNTELVAKTVASEISADVLKVEDAEKPGKLKVYFSGSFAAKRGRSWPIKTINVLLKDYDRIFIGAPVWAGKAAPEINAYIEQAELKGKAVVVFVTMGGSKSDEAIQSLTAKVEAREGKVVSSFSVKTGGTKKDEIVTKAKEAARQYK